jgi:hypothetical protein
MPSLQHAFCDESLHELGISLALEAPLGVPSYHSIVGNLEHGNIQEHLSHGILDTTCFHVLHSSISIYLALVQVWLLCNESF